MNNNIIISEPILKEFDNLVKKAGVSKEEFLYYVGKKYNINMPKENDIIDYNAYYDSFTD